LFSAEQQASLREAATPGGYRIPVQAELWECFSLPGRQSIQINLSRTYGLHYEPFVQQNCDKSSISNITTHLCCRSPICTVQLIRAEVPSCCQPGQQSNGGDPCQQSEGLNLTPIFELERTLLAGPVYALSSTSGLRCLPVVKSANR
jgi:hypothetical protein